MNINNKNMKSCTRPATKPLISMSSPRSPLDLLLRQDLAPSVSAPLEKYRQLMEIQISNLTSKLSTATSNQQAMIESLETYKKDLLEDLDQLFAAIESPLKVIDEMNTIFSISRNNNASNFMTVQRVHSLEPQCKRVSTNSIRVMLQNIKERVDPAHAKKKQKRIIEVNESYRAGDVASNQEKFKFVEENNRLRDKLRDRESQVERLISILEECKQVAGSGGNLVAIQTIFAKSNWMEKENGYWKQEDQRAVVEKRREESLEISRIDGGFEKIGIERRTKTEVNLSQNETIFSKRREQEKKIESILKNELPDSGRLKFEMLYSPQGTYSKKKGIYFDKHYHTNSSDFSTRKLNTIK